MIYQIYRKIVDEQPVLRIFYKMSDGTTQEKYVTDPKNICLQPDAWKDQTEEKSLSFNNVQIMASKIQVTLPNVDGQYTVQLFHENHSEKACVYIE